MGCLNSTGAFAHWFGNIHLSGPCNRACYFCIGQHMMALDPLNVLDSWPLPGFDAFVEACRARGVREVNLTGSNTDPLMYRHHAKLTAALRAALPGCVLGLRTNGALAEREYATWRLYDKASISLTTFDPDLYVRTMGCGKPPDVAAILAIRPEMPVKVNVVLCPEVLRWEPIFGGDLYKTLRHLCDIGVRKVNLREPYGQPHIGDPFACGDGWIEQVATRLGMPVYSYHGMEVMYWDIHYVEVESVNLYASGRVSETYPITKGHAPDGLVLDQSHWAKSGRQQEQWLGGAIGA